MLKEDSSALSVVGEKQRYPVCGRAEKRTRNSASVGVSAVG
jgi:hypothetical protein